MLLPGVTLGAIEAASLTPKSWWLRVYLGERTMVTSAAPCVSQCSMEKFGWAKEKSYKQSDLCACTLLRGRWVS